MARRCCASVPRTGLYRSRSWTNGGAWSFDTEAGKQEILFRRIGQNELTAIRVCHELVDAEKAYYAKPRGDDAVKQYAQRFVSDRGGHNGLYWWGADDEPESPIGPLLADAGSDGAAQQRSTGPIPFHGYYYRLLTSQGTHAPGGAQNYVVSGKMTRGFAFVAYPSGIPVFGRDDVHRQPGRNRLREGLRRADRRHRSAPQRIRSGSDLAPGGIDGWTATRIARREV